MKLEFFRAAYSILRLPPNSTTPQISAPGLVSVTRSEHEVSIVGPSEQISEACRNLQGFEPSTDCQIQTGFRCFRIAGQLNFNLIGLVAGITSALAANQISVLVIATFDTDYFLVPSSGWSRVQSSLREIDYDWVEID